MLNFSSEIPWQCTCLFLRSWSILKKSICCHLNAILCARKALERKLWIMLDNPKAVYGTLGTGTQLLKGAHSWCKPSDVEMRGVVSQPTWQFLPWCTSVAFNFRVLMAFLVPVQTNFKLFVRKHSTFLLSSPSPGVFSPMLGHLPMLDVERINCLEQYFLSRFWLKDSQTMFSSRRIGVTQEFMLPVTQRAQALNQLSLRAKWLLPSYSKALLQTLCLFQLLCFMSEIYKCRKVLRVFFGMLLHTK